MSDVCLRRQLLCFDPDGLLTWKMDQISMYVLFVLLL